MRSYIPYPVGMLKGLNANLHSTLIEDGESPDLKHLRFHKGVLKKDFGFADFGDQMDLQNMWLDQFLLTSGTSHLLGFSLDKSYKYNSGGDTWTSITKTGPVEWTGDEDDIFHGTTYKDIYFVTNGKDSFQWWNGAGVFADATGVWGTEYIPKYWISFYSYLLMLNTLEGGTAYTQRVRWNDTATDASDATKWAGGNSGYIDLDDDSDFVRAGRMLLGRVMVYKENSIYELTYAGEPDIFTADPITKSRGIKAVNTLDDIEGIHVFLGSDDLYVFDGRVTQGLGSKKFKEYLFGPNGVIDTAKINRCWGKYIQERSEYWLGIPVGASTPDIIVKYNVRNQEFTKRETSVTAVGLYISDATLTWNNLTPAPQYAWENLDWNWNDRTLSQGAPVIILGANDGYTYKDDSLSTADDGVEQEVVLNTKDFIFSSTGETIYSTSKAFESVRIGEFDVLVKGNGTMYISYSTDEGNTFSAEDSFTLTGAFKWHEMFLNITVEQIRWKIRTSAVNFEIKSFKPWLLERKRRVAV